MFGVPKYTVNSVIIERGHKDECKHYGYLLEACIFVVNEEQAFEASCFKWKLYYG
jgi:hypothetical protein